MSLWVFDRAYGLTDYLMEERILGILFYLYKPCSLFSDDTSLSLLIGNPRKPWLACSLRALRHESYHHHPPPSTS